MIKTTSKASAEVGARRGWWPTPNVSMGRGDRPWRQSPPRNGKHVFCGKPHETTIPDKKAPCPLDELNRRFRAPAPAMWRTPDFVHVVAWKALVYVAFVIDAFAGKIVHSQVSTSAHAAFVLDALDRAVHERRRDKGMGPVRHDDCGSQDVFIPYAERTTAAGAEPLVDSVGEGCGNAPAETANGLLKAEVIHRRERWRCVEAVDYATRERMDWFTTAGRSDPSGRSRAQMPKSASARLRKLTSWPRNECKSDSGKSDAAQHEQSGGRYAVRCRRRLRSPARRPETCLA